MKMPVRERLLDAAERLVNQRGLHATSTDAVIATADAARRSLYTHFGSKEALVAAMLERRDDRFMRGFEADVTAVSSDPVERLLAAFSVLDVWFQQPDFNGCLFTTVVAEARSELDPNKLIALRHKTRMQAFVRDLVLAAGIPEPDKLARRLVLLMEGATIVAMLDPTAPAANDAAAIAVRLIFAEANDESGRQHSPPKQARAS